MQFERVGALAVLSLIILVACFNLIATLVLITAQKTREFGILQVLGASRTSIKSIISTLPPDDITVSAPTTLSIE